MSGIPHMHGVQSSMKITPMAKRDDLADVQRHSDDGGGARESYGGQSHSGDGNSSENNQDANTAPKTARRNNRNTSDRWAAGNIQRNKRLGFIRVSDKVLSAFMMARIFDDKSLVPR